MLNVHQTIMELYVSYLYIISVVIITRRVRGTEVVALPVAFVPSSLEALFHDSVMLTGIVVCM